MPRPAFKSMFATPHDWERPHGDITRSVDATDPPGRFPTKEDQEKAKRRPDDPRRPWRMHLAVRAQHTR